MDIYLNEKKHESYNNYICPYCKSQTVKPISNISNIMYDNTFISLINTLSSHIKNYYHNLKKIFGDINNINSSLQSQISHSKFLAKGILIKNVGYIERYRQLCDRIDMINESKKILDDNLSLINKNFNIFIKEVKEVFKKMKKIRAQKIDQDFRKSSRNDNIESKYIKNVFSENSIKDKNNKKSDNTLFNSMDSNDEEDLVRFTHSPSHKYNKSRDNKINKNIKNIFRKIKAKELKIKDNLFFRNNLSQSQSNPYLTSRDFHNFSQNRKNDYFSILKNKSNNNSKMKKSGSTVDYSRNNFFMHKKKINSKKVNRSSSVFDINKNNNLSSFSFSNQQIKINNSLPKKNSNNINNYIINDNNNNNNNINNKNNILKICYKIKKIMNILKNNYSTTNDIFNEIFDDLNNLIKNIIQNDNKINDYNYYISYNNNYNSANIKNLKNVKKGIFLNGMIDKNDNNNNLELLKDNNKILNEKIKELEKKLKDNEKFIKIYNNNSINQNEEILIAKNNKINELTQNNILLQKENNELKAKIIKLKNINKEAEKLSHIIVNKDLEIEQLKLKKKEMKNTNIESIRERNQESCKSLQYLKKEIININDINNSIDNLKNELKIKESAIKDLNKKIKRYEEEKNKEYNEKILLEKENKEFNQKIEELKNSLNEKKY